MKLCYVATDVRIPHYTGSTTHVIEVSKGLTRLGDTVFVVARLESPRQKKFEEIEGIKIFRMPRLPISRVSHAAASKKRHDIPSSFLERLYRFYLGFIHIFYATAFVVRLIRKYDIEVVMERGSSLGCGAFAGLLAGRPVVLELNDPVHNRLSLRIARKIVTTSKKLIPAKFRDKAKLVTWGVNTAMFNPKVSGDEIRRRWRIMDNRIVLFVGSFAGWHGLDDLIQASSIIAAKKPNVKFLIVGGGRKHPNYRHVIEEVRGMGLTKNFIFAGTVDYHEIPKYIAASDVAVAPYNPERSEYLKRYGFFYSPLKIFEYMAVGKPIVASRVGNILHIIKDGVTGLLFEAGNVEALAQAIIKLLDSKSIAKQLGRNAYLESRNYSWKKHSELLHNLLEEVVKER